MSSIRSALRSKLQTLAAVLDEQATPDGDLPKGRGGPARRLVREALDLLGRERGGEERVKCALCIATVPKERAERFGFVLLPPAPPRKPTASWLCGDCFADLVAIDAGRSFGPTPPDLG